MQVIVTKDIVEALYEGMSTLYNVVNIIRPDPDDKNPPDPALVERVAKLARQAATLEMLYLSAQMELEIHPSAGKQTGISH